MPTPGGLPKRGDRIRYRPPSLERGGEFYDGTVVERGRGEMWSMRVRWDADGSAMMPKLIPDAGGYWAMGCYELLEPEPVSAGGRWSPSPPAMGDLARARSMVETAVALLAGDELEPVRALLLEAAGALEALVDGTRTS